MTVSSNRDHIGGSPNSHWALSILEIIISTTRTQNSSSLDTVADGAALPGGSLLYLLSPPEAVTRLWGDQTAGAKRKNPRDRALVGRILLGSAPEEPKRPVISPSARRGVRGSTR
jgi:hypothetical protein